MATRVFLGLSALLWLPYGVWCFFTPGFLAGAAGVSFLTPTGTTELRAMYGGLQAALGALALAGALREPMRRPALIALGFATGGLGLARLLGALLDGEVSSYTAMGLGFEWASAALCAVFLARAASAGERLAPAS